MTNLEIRMNDEVRMTKFERIISLADAGCKFRHSNFEFRHSNFYTVPTYFIASYGYLAAPA
ncbi:hypothetical protein BH10PLA1_BH10PLA1_09930 [soil metagenome]